MPRRCCIWGCRSNFDPGRYVNVFSFPRNPEVRQMWINAIPYGHTLKVTDCTVVCKYHFEPDSIIYEDLVMNPNGSVSSVRRKHPKLKKGTMPSIFTNFGPHDDNSETDKPIRRVSKQNDSGYIEENNSEPILEMSYSSADGTSSESENVLVSDEESPLYDSENELPSEVEIRSCDFCAELKANIISYKGKRYCTYQCYKLRSKTLKEEAADGTSSQCFLPVYSTSNSNYGNKIKSKNDGKLLFCWESYLNKPGFIAAPVSCFKHVPMADCWDDIVVGMKVEVINMDSKNDASLFPYFYWIASVIRIYGYLVLLRYEGFSDSSRDFWVNICSSGVHPIGWCSSKGFPLIPPASLQHKYSSFWRNILVESLIGSTTLPKDFSSKLKDAMICSNLKRGMRLEVVDKGHLSAVRVATVNKVIGGRIHVLYEDCDDDGFWCHELSPLVHPVGWAQIIGHDIKASSEYAKKSVEKALFKEYDSLDATWDMFKPLPIPQTDLKFEAGMKIEAIDPLKLSTICVATVVKVLRNNYLMIGIDGMMVGCGSDCFCYHSSSPYIFPIGFCEENGLELTPPLGYEDHFNWEDYLHETNSCAASAELFEREIPDHGFFEGMYLEAVDLMEPRFVCVGVITRVVGRLLRVHFDGWQDEFDQWCDCESPDLFPVGWCQIFGYHLEPPYSDTSDQPARDLRNKKEERTEIKTRMPWVSDIPNLLTEYNVSRRQTWLQKQNSEEFREREAFDEKVRKAVFKCAQIKPEPARWTALDVSQFLEMNGCGLYSEIFYNENIDGAAFLNLTKEKLMCLTGMKLGPSLKVFHMIQLLKKK